MTKCNLVFQQDEEKHVFETRVWCVPSQHIFFYWPASDPFNLGFSPACGSTAMIREQKIPATGQLCSNSPSSAVPINVIACFHGIASEWPAHPSHNSYIYDLCLCRWKSLSSAHVWKHWEDRVNSSSTKELEGADNPDTAKLWRVQSAGKLCPKMHNENVEIGKSLVLLLAIDHVSPSTGRSMPGSAAHVDTARWAQLSISSTPMGTVCLGTATVPLLLYKWCGQTPENTQVTVQVRAETSPANPEELPS